MCFLCHSSHIYYICLFQEGHLYLIQFECLLYDKTQQNAQFKALKLLLTRPQQYHIFARLVIYLKYHCKCHAIPIW